MLRLLGQCAAIPYCDCKRLSLGFNSRSLWVVFKFSRSPLYRSLLERLVGRKVRVKSPPERSTLNNYITTWEWVQKTKNGICLQNITFKAPDLIPFENKEDIDNAREEFEGYGSKIDSIYFGVQKKTSDVFNVRLIPLKCLWLTIEKFHREHRSSMISKRKKNTATMATNWKGSSR